MIFRIKRGLYTLNEDLFKMKNIAEKNINLDNKLVISDIYYDYLKENKVVPSLFNIYVDDALFNKYNHESVNLFYEYYKNIFFRLNHKHKLSDKQIILLKVLMYINSCKKYLINNELYNYIDNKINSYQITISDLKQFLLNINFLKIKKENKYYFKKIIKESNVLSFVPLIH